MSGRLPPRLDAWLRRTVEQQLLSSAASMGGTRSELERATARMAALDEAYAPLEDALAQSMARVRFTPRTTVARALALHPGAVDVLAAHQLDRCSDCPVRHDETLDEVARGHDIPLEQLLSSLDALL